YVYLTANVGLSGPTVFQNFEIDIVLHADHLTVVALAVIELCVIGVLGWHRIAGRNEPGPARFQALISALLFGCVGALLSTDLAELFMFWALAGGATYLMLAHRWGDEAAARSGRIALALPFLTDLFLLCGIAVLYSRYGQQNLSLARRARGPRPTSSTRCARRRCGRWATRGCACARARQCCSAWPSHWP